jgi:hypothetical protein
LPLTGEILISTNRGRVLGLSILVVGLGLVSSPASAAMPTCRGEPATIVGTGGDDRINGTSGDDVIWSGEGDDVVNGKGGNDTICLGSGDDEGRGGSGDDYILGGAGNDVLSGNKGNDTVNGGKGIDLCRQGSKRKCEQRGDIERDLFELVNEARADACSGAEPLIRKSKYDWMAGFHSWEMAARGFFSHTSPTLGGLVARAEFFKLQGNSHGENISIFTGPVTAEVFFDLWWASMPHHDNICDPMYEMAGFGVIVSGSSGWATQVFGY